MSEQGKASGNAMRTSAATALIVFAGAVPACQSSTVGSGVEIIAPATTHRAVPAPTPTSTAPRPVPAASPRIPEPATVVRAYITAINRHDYPAAWAIYEPAATAKGRAYASFAAGFRSTAHDEIAALDTSGWTVRIDLLAAQVDGTVRQYAGTYTVHDGRITASDIAAVS